MTWKILEFQRMPRVTPAYPESERHSTSHDALKIIDDEDRGEGIPRGNLIAHIYNHTGKVRENAHLLVAAPELLAECLEARRQIAACLERHGQSDVIGVALAMRLNSLDAVIAKATGGVSTADSPMV